jgi:hypothetical protein
VVIVLAMLAPKGTSVLRSTYATHRVYEDLAERLNERGVHHALPRHLTFVRRPGTAASTAPPGMPRDHPRG